MHGRQINNNNKICRFMSNLRNLARGPIWLWGARQEGSNLKLLSKHWLTIFEKIIRPKSGTSAVVQRQFCFLCGKYMRATFIDNKDDTKYSAAIPLVEHVTAEKQHVLTFTRMAFRQRRHFWARLIFSFGLPPFGPLFQRSKAKRKHGNCIATAVP